MASFRKITLAATGQTGNNTHTAVEVGDENSQSAFEFVVESVGATPTVTWKVQGSMDGSNFYDLAYLTDATDTVAVATRTATAVGRQIAFLSRPTDRFYRYFRVVTTLNTNVTYSAVMYVGVAEGE